MFTPDLYGSQTDKLVQHMTLLSLKFFYFFLKVTARRPFFLIFIRQVSLLHSICTLRDQGLSLREAGWIARQPKSGFSVSIGEKTRESGVRLEKDKQEGGLSE